MPRRNTYVPTHRGPAPQDQVKKRLRKSVVFSGVAVAATGLAVSSGIALTDDAPRDTAEATLTAAGTGASAQSADAPEDRTIGASRSDRRTSIDRTKKTVLDQESGGQTATTEDLSPEDPRDIARAMLPEFGFADSEFSCLDSLYVSESNWRVDADNPSSSAYGIPQSLPGEKMASAGADWATNPATQIEWGLGYIQDRYGTPCAAWSFKQGNGWY